MHPVKTKNTTTVLGAPADWDEARHGECIGLPVTFVDGTLQSTWKVSFKERLRILFGAPVRLCVTGLSHPPVWLDVAP